MFFGDSGRAPVEKTSPSQLRMTLDSMSRPESQTTTSCPRPFSSDATAKPGNACPPVPPQATTIFTLPIPFVRRQRRLPHARLFLRLVFVIPFLSLLQRRLDLLVLLVGLILLVLRILGGILVGILGVLFLLLIRLLVRLVLVVVRLANAKY